MMKTRIGFFAAFALALFAVNAGAQNPDAPKYSIYFTSGPVIDASLDDWSQAEWVTYDKDTVAETGGYNWNDPDAVCTFAMMYNDEALYCAAEVEDNFISFAEGTTTYAWWERDGVQWFIDFTHNPAQDILLYPDFYQDTESGGQWLPGEMIIAIGATEDQTVDMTRQWCVGTRLGARSDSSDKTLEDGTIVRGEVNTAWESVVKIEEGKYIIEVKIPWDSLEHSLYYSDPDPLPDEIDYDLMDQLGWTPMLPDPLEGSMISFTHLCIDTDLPEGGFDAQAMWVGDGDNDANWTEATFMIPTSILDWPLQ